MKILPTARILLLAFAVATFVSCGGDASPFKSIEPPASRFPAATVEVTRPLVNTDLTYYRLVDMDEGEKNAWVDVVESTLKELLRSEVEVEDAWATPYFTHPNSGCNIGRVGPILAVRLAAPTPLMAEQGFTEDPVVSWVQESCIPKETRHYTFRAGDDIAVPGRALELTRPMDDTSTLFHRLWTHTDPCDAVWDGVESLLGTLVEEGVDVRKAWTAATPHSKGQLGFLSEYAIVVEVGSDEQPLLERSGFLEEPYNSWNDTVALMWNYCFDDCPEEIALPNPEIMWLAPFYPGPNIYYRSIPSSEYEEVIGDQSGAEEELQRLARGGLEVGQAWIPTTASGSEYTHIVVELAVDERRVAGWGYLREPGGDPPEFTWDYMWHYDLDPASIHTTSARSTHERRGEE